MFVDAEGVPALRERDEHGRGDGRPALPDGGHGRDSQVLRGPQAPAEDLQLQAPRAQHEAARGRHQRRRQGTTCFHCIVRVICVVLGCWKPTG